MIRVIIKAQLKVLISLPIGTDNDWGNMKQVFGPTQKLPIKDFAKKVICDGHVYLQNSNGRKFYLMKPGVLIEPEFIKKHAAHNTVFEYQSVINLESKEVFLKKIKELNYLRFEKDLKEKVVEIIAFFQEVHSKKEHFLNFSLACFESFCSIPTEFLLKMHDTDMFLFRKALYSSAFAVIIGMTNDYYHPLMLKDFYNLTFALDIGLCESSYSYYVAQACNQENRIPGTGKKWMENERATGPEKNVFISHPARSYQFFKSNSQILAHAELAEVALYQHELSDGSGFPRGIPKGLISSWESIVMLADSMVEIQDEYEFETEVLQYIVDFKNEKLKDLPVGRVYCKLCEGLNFFVNNSKEEAS